MRARCNIAVYRRLIPEWDPDNTCEIGDLTAGSKRRVKWICAVDSGHRWETTFRSRTETVKGCPYCAGQRVSADRSLAAVRPDLAAQWAEENDRRPEDVTASSGYKATWTCAEQPAHRWRAAVYSRLKTGCPYCAGQKTALADSLAVKFPALLAEWGDNPVPADRYACNSHHRASWVCARGHRWLASIANRTRRGAGCPYCSGHRPTTERNLAVTHPLIAAEWGDNDIAADSRSQGSSEIVEWVCPDDPRHRWRARIADRTAKGTKCRRCNASTSRGEQEVLQYVRSIGFPDADSSWDIIPPRQLDVWVPERRVGIEYDGLMWHSPCNSRLTEADRQKHLPTRRAEKFKAVTAISARLLTVFESDWLHRRAAVEGYIAAVLGVYRTTTGARKTAVVEVSPGDARDFMNRHHVLGAGAPRATWIRGLRGGDGVVAVMVCGEDNSRRARGGRRRWVLSRYAVASGARVVGGFARLWAAFLRDVDPADVVTFSDRRWSRGDLYGRHGFVLDGAVRPSYWYFRTPGLRLMHKSGFQKSALAARGIAVDGRTEREIAADLGLRRIYDLGLDRWVWRRP